MDTLHCPFLFMFNVCVSKRDSERERERERERDSEREIQRKGEGSAHYACTFPLLLRLCRIFSLRGMEREREKKCSKRERNQYRRRFLCICRSLHQRMTGSLLPGHHHSGGYSIEWRNRFSAESCQTLKGVINALGVQVSCARCKLHIVDFHATIF